MRERKNGPQKKVKSARRRNFFKKQPSTLSKRGLRWKCLEVWLRLTALFKNEGSKTWFSESQKGQKKTFFFWDRYRPALLIAVLISQRNAVRGVTFSKTFTLFIFWKSVPGVSKKSVKFCFLTFCHFFHFYQITLCFKDKPSISR